MYCSELSLRTTCRMAGNNDGPPPPTPNPLFYTPEFAALQRSMMEGLRAIGDHHQQQIASLRAHLPGPGGLSGGGRSNDLAIAMANPSQRSHRRRDPIDKANESGDDTDSDSSPSNEDALDNDPPPNWSERRSQAPFNTPSSAASTPQLTDEERVAAILFPSSPRVPGLRDLTPSMVDDAHERNMENHIRMLEAIQRRADDFYTRTSALAAYPLPEGDIIDEEAPLRKRIRE